MEKAQFDIYNKIDPDADVRAIFDQKNFNWQDSAEYLHHFVRIQMQHLNHKLLANGYLFVNDVFDALGIDRTPAGQLLGWNNFGKKMDYTFSSDNESGWIVLKNAHFLWHTL